MFSALQLNENATAILWNVSALSIGNALDLLPADSRIFLKKLPFVPVKVLLDIDGEMGIIMLQTSAFFFFLPLLTKVLACLITSRKAARGFCL